MRITEVTNKDIVRFWDNVRKTGYCWWWNGGLWGGIKGRRYGCFWMTGESKNISAHRFSYLLSRGKLPKYPSKSILHACNNKLCVNPVHLYEGNHKDNARDSIKAGTFNFYPRRRLSQDNVEYIRDKFLPWNRKFGIAALAKKFGVSEGTIGDTVHMKSWRLEFGS